MISVGAVATYDTNKILVVFGGYTLDGFAEDSKVTVEYNEDSWTLQIGVDGEGTRSKVNNRSGKVTVRLRQTADSNAILSGLAESDRLTNAGALPLMVKDAGGDSLHLAETAWIVRIPSAEYAAEAGEREWVFETDVLVTFLGGN